MIRKRYCTLVMTILAVLAGQSDAGAATRLAYPQLVAQFYQWAHTPFWSSSTQK